MENHQHKSMNYFTGYENIMNTINDIIKEYSNTYSFFPCGKPDTEKMKAPSISSWSKFQKERPSNKQLEEWCKTKKDNVWALATGKNSGIFVVDCDTHEIAKKFEIMFSVEPNIKTKNGKHFYFKYPNNIEKIKNSTKKFTEFPNVDIKADGGYVCFFGGPYKIISLEAHTPNEKLLNLIQSEKQPTPQKQEYTSKRSDKARRQFNKLNKIKISEIIDLSLLRDEGNGELRGAHPYHGSKNGNNFAVNVDKNIWHCFRCGKGGTTAHLIALDKDENYECGDHLDDKKIDEIFEYAIEKGFINNDKKALSDNEIEKLEAEKEKLEVEIEMMKVKKRHEKILDKQNHDDNIIIDSIYALVNYDKAEHYDYDKPFWKIYYGNICITLFTYEITSVKNIVNAYLRQGMVITKWKNITKDLDMFMISIVKNSIKMDIDATNDEEEYGVKICSELCDIEHIDKIKDRHKIFNNVESNAYVDRDINTLQIESKKFEMLWIKASSKLYEMYGSSSKIRQIMDKYIAINPDGKKRVRRIIINKKRYYYWTFKLDVLEKTAAVKEKITINKGPPADIDN